MQKYCQECGELLINKELENEGIVPFCTKCQQYRFPLFNVAVSMIVLDPNKKQILLIKQYGREDYILVAGYVNRIESLEEAVIREVKEEIGLDVAKIKFNRTRFYERSNTLMCNFTTLVDSENKVCTNQEVDFYHWFSYEDAKKNIKENSLAAYFLNTYLNEMEDN